MELCWSDIIEAFGNFEKLIRESEEMNKKELANRIQQGFFDLAPEARSLSGYQFLRRIAVVIILIGLGAGV